MIEKLVIKNGKLDLEFNKYNYTYTVEIAKDVDSLIFDYELEEGYELSILNNRIEEDEGIVYLKSTDGDNSYTYTFLVYKENQKEVASIDNYKATLNVNEETSPISYTYVFIGCVIILLAIFILLFKKRKKF